MPQLKPLLKQVHTVEMSMKTSCLTFSFMCRGVGCKRAGLGLTETL